MTARDRLIAKVLEHEGGVADVGDGKGITRWGQTPGWLADFGLPVPTNATEAAANYAAWMRVTRLDRLISTWLAEPDSLIYAVVDLSVHSGHVTAIKALQRVCGLTEDGVIGPATIGAVQTDTDRDYAAAHLIAWRMEQQGRLIARDPARYARFSHGWGRRNADHVRGLA